MGICDSSLSYSVKLCNEAWFKNWATIYTPLWKNREALRKTYKESGKAKLEKGREGAISEVVQKGKKKP